MDRQSLTELRNNLNEFAVISGLVCNFDKSSVMLTYNPDPDEIEIVNDLGFVLTDSIKLLSIDIVKTLDNSEAIFTGILEKIIRSANFWERFKLSLPGRISVAKTFLISQLNYVGCFLEPPEGLLDRIQVIIDNFI
jgi:hypothetical protein